MTTFLRENFKDVRDGVYGTHPLDVIRAASLSNTLVERFADSHNRPGALRTVLYEVPDSPPSATVGYEVRLELMMVEAVLQLTTLTAAILTEISGETEGRLYHTDGRMKAAAAVNVNTALGWMFTEYTELQKNRITDAKVVTQIEDGDWFWVIRKGTIEVKVGETNAGVTAVGDLMVSDLDNTHSEGGRVKVSTVIGDTSVGNEASNIVEHTAQKVLGQFLAVGAAEDDLVLAHVDITRFGAELTDVVYPS